MFVMFVMFAMFEMFCLCISYNVCRCCQYYVIFKLHKCCKQIVFTDNIWIQGHKYYNAQVFSALLYRLLSSKISRRLHLNWGWNPNIGSLTAPNNSASCESIPPSHETPSPGPGGRAHPPESGIVELGLFPPISPSFPEYEGSSDEHRLSRSWATN